MAETFAEDRPMAVQIYGHAIEEMTEAARRVVDLGASAVDINMGCPVRKVVRTGGGSALMCDAVSATKLVEAVVNAVNTPVTVKMRLGWDSQSLTAPILAREFESVGVAAVIIHGRTRAGVQGIGRSKRDSRGGRGGGSHAGRRQRRHPDTGRRGPDVPRDGFAAISIGRGALANPFLFRQLAHWAEHGHPGPEPTFEERVSVMERPLPPSGKPAG